MKSPIVYFDTSFFCGLIDNTSGRQSEAQKILSYEQSEGSEMHTSIITINEFLGKTFDKYHDTPDLDDRVMETIASIRRIASIYGFNETVAKDAARIQSARGRVKMSPGENRDRKFRWDAIHLATANILHATRVYGWDDEWHKVPKIEIPNIVEIRSPAIVPMEPLFASD